jgi:glyoxylase-like metal-dependent hydrolase (beta-lactamase superfamily II)
MCKPSIEPSLQPQPGGIIDMSKFKTKFTWGLILGALLMHSLVNAQEQEAKTKEIADNVYTFTTNGEYISMFVVTEAGVMVFETVNTLHAKAMVAAIKQITDKPIKYAFHSHNHWDHSSGGQVFLDEGADTIAHTEAYAWMQANTGRDMAIPKQSWSGNRKDIELGGTKVELHYLGMNHGLGMTVFLLPQFKIAYIADLVTPNREIVRSFVDDILISRRFEKLDHYIDEDCFTQHNSRIADGLSALRSALDTTSGQDIKIQYDRIHRLLAEGSFVLSVSEGFSGGVHSAFYDLFRVVKGKLVEHWDTIEAIPLPGEWKNDNGKF